MTSLREYLVANHLGPVTLALVFQHNKRDLLDGYRSLALAQGQTVESWTSETVHRVIGVPSIEWDAPPSSWAAPPKGPCGRCFTASPPAAEAGAPP